MAALTTSCKFLVSTDAATYASSPPTPHISVTSYSNATFVTKGWSKVISGQQKKRGLAIRASTESEISRRDTLLAGVSTLGLILLPNSRAEARSKDPDMREQIMEDIENLQKRVSKTLEEAKKAVTSMAEEAIASLKISGEKAAEKVTDRKAMIDGATAQDKVAQN